MTPASIAVTAVVVLFFAATAFKLMRSLTHEMSRAPHATAFQRRYISDAQERDGWRLFLRAMGDHQLGELRRSLK